MSPPPQVLGTQGTLQNWVTSSESTWQNDGSHNLAGLQGQGEAEALLHPFQAPHPCHVPSQGGPVQECETPRATDFPATMERPAACCHATDRTCFRDSFQPHRCPRRPPGLPAIFSLGFSYAEPSAWSSLCPLYPATFGSPCNVRLNYRPGKCLLVITPLHPYMGKHRTLREQRVVSLPSWASQGQGPHLVPHPDLGPGLAFKESNAE